MILQQQRQMKVIYHSFFFHVSLVVSFAYIPLNPLSRLMHSTTPSSIYANHRDTDVSPKSLQRYKLSVVSRLLAIVALPTIAKSQEKRGAFEMDMEFYIKNIIGTHQSIEI